LILPSACQFTHTDMSRARTASGCRAFFPSDRSASTPAFLFDAETDPADVSPSFAPGNELLKLEMVGAGRSCCGVCARWDKVLFEVRRRAGSTWRVCLMCSTARHSVRLMLSSSGSIFISSMPPNVAACSESTTPKVSPLEISGNRGNAVSTTPCCPCFCFVRREFHNEAMLSTSRMWCEPKAEATKDVGGESRPANPIRILRRSTKS
jgi:hypothetical protein